MCHTCFSFLEQSVIIIGAVLTAIIHSICPDDNPVLGEAM